MLGEVAVEREVKREVLTVLSREDPIAAVIPAGITTPALEARGRMRHYYGRDFPCEGGLLRLGRGRTIELDLPSSTLSIPAFSAEAGKLCVDHTCMHSVVSKQRAGMFLQRLEKSILNLCRWYRVAPSMRLSALESLEYSCRVHSSMP